MLARLMRETLPCATSSGTTLGATLSAPRNQGGSPARPIRSGRPRRAMGVARSRARIRAPALARWHLRSRLTPCRETVKISRRALHDELAQLIRAMIIGGELSPGQRINE